MSAVSRPSGTTERIQFTQANSFVTPLVLSFCSPEQRATLAGVNKAYSKAAWNPANSPMTKTGETHTNAATNELAHLQDALGNREITDLNEARKQYRQTRRFEHLADLDATTFLRAAPENEFGLEIVKVQSLSEGSCWTRLKNKILFYSGYEHLNACRSLVDKVRSLYRPGSVESYVGDSLEQFRDWQVRLHRQAAICKGTDRAIHESQRSVQQAMLQLNSISYLFWRIIQKIVEYFVRIPLIMPTQMNQQIPLRPLGFKVGSIPHMDKTLTVYAEPLIEKRKCTGALRYAFSDDGTQPHALVSFVMRRVWTDTSGATVGESDVEPQKGYYLRDRRLQVTQIVSMHGYEKLVRGLVKSPKFIDNLAKGLVKNTAFRKGIDDLIRSRLEGFVEKFQLKEKMAVQPVPVHSSVLPTHGLLPVRYVTPPVQEQLPVCYAAPLYQLIAGIFDQSSEQCMEIDVPHPDTDAIQKMHMRKDEEVTIPIYNSLTPIRWGFLRDTARNLSIFREKRTLLPSFFAVDLSRYAAPAPE